MKKTEIINGMVISSFYLYGKDYVTVHDGEQIKICQPQRKIQFVSDDELKSSDKVVLMVFDHEFNIVKGGKIPSYLVDKIVNEAKEMGFQWIYDMLVNTL